MSDKSRQETVVIGMNRYSVETAVDEAAWSRAMAFTEEVMAKIDSKMPSDRRLLMAWLNLVLWVDGQNRRLENLLAEVDPEENSP
ncbi:hypothetical protein L2W58_09945 [Dethiosulfovibrio sp. F2B]|uniref:hypothetical protein n=1 Tax=Dethiosulfovibrio faecalis TaxID=2720018 RepID=UPI001F1B78B1|nr:hypothetical protein [Dethiosulfovibrio faecalis]MCF4152118.1 hypothetical protein [Dethiosulfovibrio faecalis]